MKYRRRVVAIAMMFVGIGLAATEQTQLVQISLLGVNGTVATREVRSDVQRLTISESVHNLLRIDGLHQLEQLTYLSLHHVDLTSTDFGFLTVVSDTLQTLQLSFATLPNDLGFLKRAPNLVAFSSEETHRLPTSLLVDLSANSALRYFGINGGIVEDSVTIRNAPCSLEVINLMYTSFRALRIEPEGSHVDGIEVWLEKSQIENLADPPQHDLLTPDASMYSAAVERYRL